MYYTVDGHSDYTVYLYPEALKGHRNILTDDHLPKLLQGGVGLEVMTAGGDFDIGEIDYRSLNQTSKAIDAYKREIETSGEFFKLILNMEDLKKCRAENKIGTILHLEGCSPLERDICNLHKLYEMGVRSIALTHNGQNDYASGCRVNPDCGLTSLGREVIKHAGELKMIIDLAHISEKSFWDIIEIHEGPIIVSHANVKKLCDHFRNLTDYQIKAVAARKGVIGINFIGNFIDPATENITVERLVDHFMYVADLVGVDYVGIGADYVYYYRDILITWIKQHNLSMDIAISPAGLEDVTGLPLLVEHFAKRGCTKNDIEKMMGGNYLRVLDSILNRTGNRG